MQGPFIGAEAMATGRLTRHRLRTDHRAVFPGVYLETSTTPTLAARARAAWLWSGRSAVVAGLAAAAIHGSKWVDDDVPVELVSSNTRPPPGLITRNDTVLDGEVVERGGIPVTSVARTAFDLGRRGGLGQAVARLDALCRATGLRPGAIERIAASHAGTRGLRQLRRALPLIDAGAESPRETWLRLLLIGAGLPAPTTQIPVRDGDWAARLDLGWEDLKLAAEYDGDQHRTDRQQYVRDIRRLERLQQLGWIVVRVIAEDRPADIVRRVRQAMEMRGTPPPRLNPGRDFGPTIAQGSASRPARLA